MKYKIVIFPAKPLQDYANSYRKRYDPHYTHIPPHITLMASFEAEAPVIEEMIQRLHEVAHKHSPFDITITKFSTFKPVHPIIYLKIDPKDDLEDLHKEINTTLPHHLSYTDVYVPHIIIGQKLTNEEHSDVFGSLQMLKLNRKDLVDRFHLMYQLDNGSWTVYETFLLGKE